MRDLEFASETKGTGQGEGVLVLFFDAFGTLTTLIRQLFSISSSQNDGVMLSDSSRGLVNTLIW